jgi:epoxide hydrolase-like predicted phosphatase
MAKAIIFDIGGVIFEIDNIAKEYLKLCKKSNIVGKTPWDDFREEWNKTKIGEMECSAYYKIIANKLNVSEKEIRLLFINNVKLNNEMKELILELKKDYKIGILSNIIKDLLTKDLELWNFNKISKVVTSCDDKVKKPSPEAIELIIKKLDLKKDEIIFVDNSKNITEAYSRLGIKCILFENKNQLIKDLNKLGIKWQTKTE